MIEEICRERLESTKKLLYSGLDLDGTSVVEGGTAVSITAELAD